MFKMVGLMVSTGLPWQYWERQDEEIIATALEVIRRMNGGKGKSTNSSGRFANGPQMSG